MKNFKQLFILFLFAILLPISAFSKELQEQTVLDGTVKISIPKGFSLMGDKIRELKYPNRNAPTEIYSNEASTVNVAIKKKNGEEKVELEGLKKAFSLALRNLSPEIDIININGTDILKMSFISQAIDTQIHNNMILILYADKSSYIVVSCNMTEEEFSEWGETCEKVIQSIKVLNKQ